MKRYPSRSRRCGAASLLVAASMAVGLLAGPAAARDITIGPVPAHADGALSIAAARAMRGPLPVSAADVASKAAADRARDAEAGRGLPVSAGAADLARAGGAPAARRAPGVVRNFAGQFDALPSPPDTTGAVGPKRFIQMVNFKFAIYDKKSNAPIDTGTLNELAGFPAATNSFYPQIIWDATTDRFYYLIDSVLAADDHQLAYGFSKTASPNSEADFCHYSVFFGDLFPDYPIMGDSRYFVIVGTNTFTSQGLLTGSDLVAIGKPPAGAACPDVDSFAFGVKFNLTDGVNPVFTPIPGNEIDTLATGYVVARNGALPSTKLWLFSVTREAGTGSPVFGDARGATVASYTVPPSAPAGVGTGRTLDTLDARNTQAIVSINPERGRKWVSFWTQHTIRHPTQARSIVRAYEIDAARAVPVVIKTIEIGNTTPNTFFFNAAITSDRRVLGEVAEFGDSFGIGYNVTKSVAPGINPSIVLATSRNGAALVASSFVTIKSSAGPYVDSSCVGATQTCRWGDYAGATPDPLPKTTDFGKMWFTNQFGNGGASTSQANWRTRIFAATP